jgi:hypothetical protein
MLKFYRLLIAVNSVGGSGVQDNLDRRIKRGPARVEVESNAASAAPPAISAESIPKERSLNLCISR